MRTYNLTKIPIFIFLLLAIYINSYSQQWINYSVADGLSNNEITAIVEDDHGKIWVGTTEGLNRFDGRDWTVYSRSKRDSLIDDMITTIMKDSEGKLWIGTYKGLIIIDPGDDLKNPANWHNYDHFNTQGGLNDTVITTILEDDSGNVWIGTDGLGIGIVDPRSAGTEDPLLNPGNWNHAYLDSQWLNLKIIDIEKDRMGNIWVGTVGGVYRYNPEEHELHGEWDLIPDLIDVSCIFIDSENDVWFGRIDQVIARIKPSTPHQIESCYYGYNVQAIEQDRDGNLWFGTSSLADGIYMVDPETNLKDSENWFPYTQDNGLAGHLINCIYRDGEGDMWIGTGGRGISKCDISWINYSSSEIELDLTTVVAIIEDDLNNLWLGTEDKGIRVVNLDSNMLIHKNWKKFREWEKALASDHISSFYKDDTGCIWIGTIPNGFGNEGLNLVDPLSDPSNPDNWNWLTFTVENTDSGLIDNRINTIAQDNDRYMWFGTTKGLSRAHRNLITDISRIKDPDTWTKFDTSSGLVSNVINVIFIDNKHNIWVGTSKGVNFKKFDESLQQNWGAVEVLKGKEVNTIYQDLEDHLWIGTKWHGVFKVDPSSDLNSSSSWTVFTTKHGLASNNVRSIIQRQSSEYWFATGSGLTRLRISGEDSVWTIFKAEDGPASISIWAANEDSRGDVWFGTGWKGVTRHRVKTTAPETHIYSRLDVITTGNVLLTYKGSDLNTPPEKLKYSYQLNNSGWSSFQSTEMAQFFGIGNGRHLFEVRAMDLDGNIDPTPARDVFYKVDPEYGGKAELCDSMACIRIYFPPGVLKSGADGAQISRLKEYELADPTEVIVAYDIDFQEFTFQRDRSLTLALAMLNSKNFSPSELAIFLFKAESEWIGIGGTVSLIADSLVITTAITEPGIYAIRNFGIKEPTDIEISVQPRVFSPTGHGQGFGHSINISFPLKKASRVTVKIYNIAGRLKRIIIDNETLMPGINLVVWDGRDDDSNFCRSGLYVVTIEAEGKVHTKTVVVSNRYR